MRSKKLFIGLAALVLLASASLAPIAAQGRLPGYSGTFRNDPLLDREYLIILPAERYGFLRNEIYASYGRAFATQKYRDYFSQKPWYKVVPSYKDSWLTPNDRTNAAFIQSFENPADEAAARAALAAKAEFPIGGFLGSDEESTVVFTESTAILPDSLHGEDDPYYQWNATSEYQMKGSWAILALSEYEILAIRFDFSGDDPVVADAFVADTDK